MTSGLVLLLLLPHAGGLLPVSDDIPAFDIPRRCEQALLLTACVEREHTALNVLRYWWPRLDDRVKAGCSDTARGDPFLNYSHLTDCVAHRGHLPQQVMASFHD